MEQIRHDVEQGLETLLPRLWRFAVTVTKDDTKAEDLVQDTCVRALQHADKFRAGTHLDRWCFTIMANIWRSSFRRKTPDLIEDEALNRVASQSPTPEASLYARQVLDQVDQLAEGQREVIVLVYGEGFAYKEAAAILDIPIGTVMSRLHAARSKLAHLAH
ncbi:MAG: RNA polymerase sigma factor [Pseudomonadota bacterium]